MVKKVAKQKFAEALLKSVDEALTGQNVTTHTPEAIARRRGRPPGSTAEVRKEAVSIRFDPDILAALRQTGAGWQTRVNDHMRTALQLAGLLRSE